ncbi:MAG: L,D-transpeptidase family protein [Hyphomicrobiales bacterium]|nr:L,D-transpeptidase family protein [Hyphomicrobiales bacterium]
MESPMRPEIDRRRCVPRAAALVLLAGLWVIPPAPRSLAQETIAPSSVFSAISRLPLPPYPPPISGFEERKDPVSLETAASPRLPETLSRETSPETKPLVDTKAASDEKKQSPAFLGETGSGPPATTTSGTNSAEEARAVFDKVAQSALFPRLNKAERHDITSFYESRAFTFLWYQGGTPTHAAVALLDRLTHAGEEGLDADDYVAAATPPVSSDVKDVAEAEWRLSAAVVAYARDARGARIAPNRISNLITPKLVLPDVQSVLETLWRAPDASAALEAFNPRTEGYANLRTALAALRAKTGAASPSTGDAAANAQLASVAPEMLKARHGSAVDQGGTRVVSALSLKRVEADIIANMERWRWLPPELGERYIFINVPEFTLRYVNNGVLTHQARVIVGKPSSPTPLFSAEMKFLVVNPSWYVPPSILKKEFLPKLAGDPLFAERQGYEVVQHGDRISIRQPPGERNALGRIKFMFPNDHAVYLHDTPTRNLFAQAERAFSHGCVRVDQPFKLAEYVMNDEASWPERRIEKMVGGSERTINLTQELPVHLAYFTVAADAAGTLHRFGDLYGLDPRLEAMLSPRK